MYSCYHISYFIKKSTVILSLVVSIESFQTPFHSCGKSSAFSNISSNFCSYKLVCMLLMDSQFCIMSLIAIYLLSSTYISVFTFDSVSPCPQIAIHKTYRVCYELLHRKYWGENGDKHYRRWFKIEHYTFLLHK